MDGSYSIVIDGERFDVQVRSLGNEPGRRSFEVRIGDREHLVSVDTGDRAQPERRPDLSSVAGPRVKPNGGGRREAPSNGQASVGGGNAVGAPMTGKIVSIHVTEGQKVEEGDLLVVLEAMKMENSILALEAGVVSGISVNVGDSVRKGHEICSISKAG